MDLNHLLLSSGLLYSILALVLYFRKAPNKKSRRILSLLLLSMGIYSELIYFHHHIVVNEHSFVASYLPVDGVFLIFMGPCLYYYTLSVLNIRFNLRRWITLIQIIPYVPFVWLNTRLYLMPSNQRIEWLQRDLYLGNWEMTVINIVIYASTVIYLIISTIPVIRQMRKSRFVEHNGYEYNISWLYYFLLINLTFMIGSSFFCFYYANEKTNIIIGQIAMNIEFIFLFIMTVSNVGLNQTEKNKPDNEMDNRMRGEQNLNSEKRIGFTLNETQANEYYSRLINYMEIETPYLTNKCTVDTLSNGTNIPAHHISCTLNTHNGIKVTDFINEYRVSSAKQLLAQNKLENNKTFDEIAMCCGFGSTRTFNRVFKSFTGTTPAQYRKEKLD